MVNYKFSFIFQIHNREATIKELLQPFVEAQNQGYDCQIIVCNDGSTDRTGERLLEIMSTAVYAERNTILTTFDIYETPMTWRTIQMAEGEILVLIQDDDYYPSMEFADKAYQLFQKYPELAGLSPKHGVMINENMSITAIYGTFNSSDLPVKSPQYNEEGVQFVHIIDRAPMIIRRTHYDLIGGVDTNLKRAVYNDWDMCLSWAKQNLKVGIYHSDTYQFRRWHAGSTLPGADTQKYVNENRRKVFLKHFSESWPIGGN